jgi:hypothetical protein
MKNWIGFEKKRSWPNLTYYPDICLEGLRKAVIILSQDNPYQGRDFNPEPPGYRAGVLRTRLPFVMVQLGYYYFTYFATLCELQSLYIGKGKLQC